MLRWIEKIYCFLGPEKDMNDETKEQKKKIKKGKGEEEKQVYLPKRSRLERRKCGCACVAATHHRRSKYVL